MAPPPTRMDDEEQIAKAYELLDQIKEATEELRQVLRRGGPGETVEEED
jgi:hypothetical protein